MGQSSVRRLEIRRETIRTLNPQDLAQANGALSWSLDTSAIYCNPATPPASAVVSAVESAVSSAVTTTTTSVSSIVKSAVVSAVQSAKVSFVLSTTFN
ncbi:MAG: hypothetical protein HJJLKODD_00715 [Phycisphaerae bacterium]|nr:hypothetical protein [Phycisphaerae bacterium]